MENDNEPENVARIWPLAFFWRISCLYSRLQPATRNWCWRSRHEIYVDTKLSSSTETVKNQDGRPKHIEQRSNDILDQLAS